MAWAGSGRSGEGLERIAKQAVDIMVRKKVDGTRGMKGFSQVGVVVFGILAPVSAPRAPRCGAGPRVTRECSRDGVSVVRVSPGESCVRYSASAATVLTFEVFALVPCGAAQD
jgi:hypothetical protein